MCGSGVKICRPIDPAKGIRYCQYIMATIPEEDHVRTEAELEAEADRNLAKRLSGARINLIGQTVTNFFEYTPGDCPVCEKGEKQKAYDATREHGVCLACGGCTKYLQRSINAVLRTLDQQKRFWQNYRLARIKFKVKGKGRGNHGADPCRNGRFALQGLAERRG